jgi:hypothetical protein
VSDTDPDAERKSEGRRAADWSEELAPGADRRLADVGEDLIGRVLRLRQAEAMLGELDATVARLREAARSRVGGDGQLPAAAPAPERRQRREPAPGAAAPQPQQEIAGVSDEGLVEATQMALAGKPRAEIEATLRRSYGVEDPAPIVDRILGSRDD